MRLKSDVAIIGSGFGGSITALCLARLGLRPLLIEKHAHPRFAIGESSTPIADLALRGLAERLGLPRLAPLTRYGEWRATYPQVMRGLKRGFSYFQHRRGERFTSSEDHATELLVAANPNDERADTHWRRSDVDHFLVREVQEAGITFLDHTQVLGLAGTSPWRLCCDRAGDSLEIETAFVIDASGGERAWPSLLNLADDSAGLSTHSRAIYSHFEGVARWSEVLAADGVDTRDHPFDCDAAALHHVFDGGWMWVLRFDDDVVSAGLVLDDRRFPLDAGQSPQAEWTALLRRYPSIAGQFTAARPLRPFRRTGRLQRRVDRIAGPDWALLPSAAYFLDPLHSTGIAHTMTGIERLIDLLAPGGQAGAGLAAYQDSIRREIVVLDRLIDGCYRAFGQFDVMTSFAMLYFAGAVSSEHRRRAGVHAADDGYLMCHDQGYCQAVSDGYRDLCALAARSAISSVQKAKFLEQVVVSITPYNPIDLCDPSQRNMYPFN